MTGYRHGNTKILSNIGVKCWWAKCMVGESEELSYLSNSLSKWKGKQDWLISKKSSVELDWEQKCAQSVKITLRSINGRADILNNVPPTPSEHVRTNTTTADSSDFTMNRKKSLHSNGALGRNELRGGQGTRWRATAAQLDDSAWLCVRDCFEKKRVIKTGLALLGHLRFGQRLRQRPGTKGGRRHSGMTFTKKKNNNTHGMDRSSKLH